MVLASEAVRLFVDRATGARPTFRVDGANAATVAAICVRLDGMPLAIELAAARVRSLSPERILDGLSDRFRLLTGGARTAVARQQTLQASGAPLLEALEADHDNFRAALQWTLGQEDGNGALQLVIALFPFWHIHGHYTEALDWCRRALEASADRGTLRVRAMTNVALLS